MHVANIFLLAYRYNEFSVGFNVEESEKQENCPYYR